MSDTNQNEGAVCNHGTPLAVHCPKCAAETQPLPFAADDIPPSPHQLKYQNPEQDQNQNQKPETNQENGKHQ